jgi:hypothetical protein
LLAVDAGYGDSSPLRAALDKRGIVYSARVNGDALARPPPTWHPLVRNGPPTDVGDASDATYRPFVSWADG